MGTGRGLTGGGGDATIGWGCGIGFIGGGGGGGGGEGDGGGGEEIAVGGGGWFVGGGGGGDKSSGGGCGEGLTVTFMSMPPPSQWPRKPQM